MEGDILPGSSEPPTIGVDRQTVAAVRTSLVADAFEAYGGKLTSFAFGITRDREAADDLVQETFLRLVREITAGRTPDNIAAWLFRVCSNAATSRGRRVKVARRFLQAVRKADDEPPADVEILHRETNAILLAALQTVPADARAALLMAAQGFSGREIAEAIGRSEIATRTLMFRAREKMRVTLVREGVRS